MEFPRASGIVLHPTSLPGAYGMGEIGVHARRWVDTLVAMRQKLWQVLPLGPTGYGDSPYQSLSTFAGNDRLVCFETLVAQKLLRKTELKGFPDFPRDTVDYGPVLLERRRILDLVTASFAERATAVMKKRYTAFLSEQAFWLEDFALFVACKEAHGLRPWTEWPAPLASYLIGESSEADLKAAANTGTEILRKYQDFDWHFYLGAAAMIQGDKEKARAYFDHVVDTDMRQFLEYSLARIFLENLGGRAYLKTN